MSPPEMAVPPTVQRGVQDFVAPLGGRLIGHRRVAPREAGERHGGAEALLVQLERLVTLAVENQAEARLDVHASIMAATEFVVL